MSTSQDIDQQLLNRVRAGDEHAFETLFRTHYPGLLRFAELQLGDRTDAEDTVHDVFLRVWSDRERIGGDRSLRSYLLAAVRNRVIDRLRHRKLERRWIERLPEPKEGDRPGMVADLPDRKASTDAAALAELDGAIRRAVADLPERCRTAFLLCREQELTYAEAAQVMGVTPATVKTQMARALGALREMLRPFLVPLTSFSIFGG